MVTILKRERPGAIQDSMTPFTGLLAEWPFILCLAGLLIGMVTAAYALPPAHSPAPVMSTEDFLNHLGVNTHLNGLTRQDPWTTDPARVASQLRYIGVRLDRDWAWSAADGDTWKAVQKRWPLGKFWSSIDEASPANQRRDLAVEEAIAARYPGLIYAMGGPNEEDDPYPQAQGASLPDSTLVQQSLYRWAHSAGRRIPVSQMEFGAGWTAANQWQGDYNPINTGIGQNYTPGPADLAAAHTYISNDRQRPVEVLAQLRTLARLTTPGRPVAHTEVGAYRDAKLSSEEFGQYLVMGAFDSAAAGDTAYLVYGLQDSGPERTYGFFTYPGGKPNPAADDFHTMTTLLKSARGAYGPGSKPTFKPGTLHVSFSKPGPGHLVMQKPTGEFVIAEWSEPLRDGPQHDVSDTIEFGRTLETLKVYDIEQGLTPLATVRRVSRYVLTMKPGDTYLLVLK